MAKKPKPKTQGSDIDRIMTEKMELVADIKNLKETLRTTRLNARKLQKEYDELKVKSETATKLIKHYEQKAESSD